jgi:hypothetical protein
MAELTNKLRILAWAIEALDKDASEDFVEYIQEDLIPHAEELEKKK